MKKLGITILTFFLFLNFLTSQTTETVKGREFIVHTVTKGETVYGISKKYEVPQDTILFYNSSAKTGIKTDQVLKFPSKNAIKNSASGITIIKHTVNEGETLSSIAKKYKVTIDEIRKANSQITNIDVLKIDDVINIPLTNGNTLVNTNTNQTITTTNVTEVKDDKKIDTKPNNNSGDKENNFDVICDTIKTVKKNYNIALILPFKGNNFASSKIATEFYYGFKVALDSVVAKMKVGVKLYVMNSTAANDSDKTADQYDFDKLKKMDLIVGPLFSANIKPIAQFALENRIPIVSPFTKSVSLLEGNPFAIKITPSEKTLAKRTLTYFNTTYPNCNFILVNTGTRRDSTLHLAYSEALDELGIKDTNRIHKVGKGGSPGAFFKGGVKNVVMYMNSKEVTVKAFITSFNQSHKKTDVILVGTEGWLEFNNVEADYYMNLNLHIPVATYADYTDSTKYDYFIRKYQYTVKADPTDYSFTGYKIGSDFMRRFFTYGPHICNCVDQFKESEDEKQKLPFNFWFERKSENDGWENSAIQILRVQEDYILDIVNY